MRNVFFLVTGLIIGLFLGTCNRCSPGYQCAGDTVSVKHDTVWVHVSDSSPLYTPQIAVIEGGRIPDQVDTPKVIREYFALPVYHDTVETRYGFVYIDDTLNQNRILNRQVFTDMHLPIVTNTITIREKPRNQVYFGMGAAGGLGVPMAIGPSLMLKTKGGPSFEIGALINTKSQWQYTGSMKFLIHLKR